MVHKRTENILIGIVIVYSLKIFELTVIKYFQKFIIKVQKLGGVYKVLLVCIRLFKKKVLEMKNVSVI